MEETGRSVDVDMGLDIDLDAEPGRFADQEARRADPALAEMKVVADRDAADSEPFDQVMVNEILRRGPGAALVEGHHHGAGKPGPGQQPELAGLVGEPELGGVRAEEAARMGLEGHRQRRPAMGAAHLQGGGDHRAVAEMNAIEIAHRHHRPPGDVGCGRGVADNGKARRHFRDSSARGRQARDRDAAAANEVKQGRIRPQNGVDPPRGQLTGCLTAGATAGGRTAGHFRPGAGSLMVCSVAGESRWRLICRCRFWWWMTTTP